MKKFIKVLTVLSLILTVISLTACSNAQLNTSNYLWFKNPTAFKTNFREVLTYDVSYVNTTNADSTPVKIDGYSLEVDEGSYVTTLEAKTNKDGNYYVYTTEFSLKAKYITPTSTKEFIDTFKSVSTFSENLKPISTSKEYFSEFSDFKYSYELIYEDNKATATLKEYNLSEENSRDNTFTFDKYTKGAFVDNDTILLIPRLFTISGTFVQDFKTIDVLSNKNHKMQYYTYLVDQNVDVKVLSGYTLNGEQVGLEGLQCNHLEVAINDNFSGSPIECYYAQDRDTHRHRLIETFTPFGNVGYLKYSLANAVVENDN